MLGDSYRALHSASLGWSVFVSTGDHPDQTGCSTYRLSSHTLYPFFGIHNDLFLFLFISSLSLQPSDIFKNSKACCLPMGKFMYSFLIKISVNSASTSMSGNSDILCVVVCSADWG